MSRNDSYYKQYPDHETIHKLMEFNFETGKITWKHRDESMFRAPQWAQAWNTRFACKPALNHITDEGYRNGSYLGRVLQSHIIIFIAYYGRTPTMILDHINGIRDDNRIENIREAGYFENTINRRNLNKNKNGYKGVFYFSCTNKYYARIRKNYKWIHLGTFNTPIEAGHAYNKAAVQLHGEFAILNPVGC